MLLNCGVGEDSWESLGLQGDLTNPPKGVQSWVFIGRTDVGSWNSNTLATWCEELTHWKRPWCWERWKAGGEGDEDEMVGWHHWLNGHEFKQALGDGAGQKSLVCCSPWGLKWSEMSERLNKKMKGRRRLCSPLCGSLLSPKRAFLLGIFWIH